MPIPKKLIKFITGAAITIGPFAVDEISSGLKKRKKKKEQERRYNNQKHNGMVKYASIVFSFIALIIAIIAIKDSKAICSILSIIGLISYVVTFLFCLDVIKEPKQNTYKITFIAGDMFMVAAATLLFF